MIMHVYAEEFFASNPISKKKNFPFECIPLHTPFAPFVDTSRLPPKYAQQPVF